jgi:hypothetical protein
VSLPLILKKHSCRTLIILCQSRAFLFCHRIISALEQQCRATVKRLARLERNIHLCEIFGSKLRQILLLYSSFNLYSFLVRSKVFSKKVNVGVEVICVLHWGSCFQSALAPCQFNSSVLSLSHHCYVAGPSHSCCHNLDQFETARTHSSSTIRSQRFLKLPKKERFTLFPSSQSLSALGQRLSNDQGDGV